MSKPSQEVVTLMRTAWALNLYNNDSSYSRLFDSLMSKFETKPVLFEYIYEQIKYNMFELKAVSLQAEEFLRLVTLSSIAEEFDNSLQQELRCLLS